jgi:hypothetical protein
MNQTQIEENVNQMDCPGIVYQRKRRGRKLQFMIGGPSLAEAAKFIRWDVPGYVYFFNSDHTGLVGLVKPLAP